MARPQFFIKPFGEKHLKGDDINDINRKVQMKNRLVSNLAYKEMNISLT